MYSQTPHLPYDLPFLPGNTKQDPTVTRHHKTQLLSVKSGAVCEKTNAWKENIDPNILQSMREGEPIKLNNFMKRPNIVNDAIPQIAPQWLKHDRQALRFQGYFQEPVVENRDENYRIRNCTFLYYLEDDSMYITEPKVENSGIPQGVFLKRHRFEKPDGSLYHWSDLDVSMDIGIYGRVFRITSCDLFTRSFYENEGVTLSEEEATPEDNFTKTRFQVNMKQNPPDTIETKEYFEAKLNGGKPNKNLASYLENDRKVLSFKVLWDDISYDGGEKKYTMNYFLADKTMEVKEVKVSNSGFDSFPMLLKRMVVPKEAVQTHYPSMSLRKEDHYSPADFMMGSVINIYGRKCLVIDCDAYTKEWYRDHMDIDQIPLKVDRPHKNLKYDPTPPYNGYGTIEDSLGSVKALDPKPPMKDEKKFFKNDMHILRFDCKLCSPEPDDENRKFIVSFFCGDDTIEVFEVCERNSGRMGGKFLERKKHTNPVSDLYYAEKDFSIGETIYLGGHRFQVNNCDEYTHKYMEDNFEVFPRASFDLVINKIKEGAYSHSSLQDYAIDLMRRLDANGDGVISFDEFRDGLQSMSIYLTDHEVNTLLRVFDHNGDGHISMEEFYNTLASAINDQNQ
jgi:hypothetical protein